MHGGIRRADQLGINDLGKVTWTSSMFQDIRQLCGGASERNSLAIFPKSASYIPYRQSKRFVSLSFVQLLCQWEIRSAADA